MTNYYNSKLHLESSTTENLNKTLEGIHLLNYLHNIELTKGKSVNVVNGICHGFDMYFDMGTFLEKDLFHDNQNQNEKQEIQQETSTPSPIQIQSESAMSSEEKISTSLAQISKKLDKLDKVDIEALNKSAQGGKQVVDTVDNFKTIWDNFFDLLKK